MKYIRSHTRANTDVRFGKFEQLVCIIFQVEIPLSFPHNTLFVRVPEYDTEVKIHEIE